MVAGGWWLMADGWISVSILTVSQYRGLETTMFF